MFAVCLRRHRHTANDAAPPYHTGHILRAERQQSGENVTRG